MRCAQCPGVRAGLLCVLRQPFKELFAGTKATQLPVPQWAVGLLKSSGLSQLVTPTPPPAPPSRQAGDSGEWSQP